MKKLHVLFMIAATAVACESPDRKKSEPSEQHDQQKSTQDVMTLEHKIKTTPNRWVTRHEFNCVTGDFDRHVKLGPAGTPSSINVTPARFKVNTFQQKIRDCECEDREAVAVHHGLDASANYVMALEFMCLSATDQGYDRTAKHYCTIENGDLKDASGPISNWIQHWNDLLARVVMDDGNGQWRSYANAPELYRQYIVYPYPGELEDLIAHNSTSGQQLAEIEIWPSAEPTSANDKDFRQGFVWIPVGIALATTQPTSSADAFKARGADLGSPCPKNCPPKILFPASGLPLRNGC